MGGGARHFLAWVPCTMFDIDQDEDVKDEGLDDGEKENRCVTCGGGQLTVTAE